MEKGAKGSEGEAGGGSRAASSRIRLSQRMASFPSPRRHISPTPLYLHELGYYRKSGAKGKKPPRPPPLSTLERRRRPTKQR
jgi:hypothetical protein